MRKKFVLPLLVLAGFGVMAMAQTCEILGATRVVIDDEVWYSAEVQNDTTAKILSHKMRVGFIDGSSLAAQKDVEPCLRSFQPGESNFFSANSGLDENDVDQALSRVIGPLTFGETVAADLTISNIEATRDNEDLVVSGRIENNDSDTLDDVRVCVVVRNQDGDVTRVEADNDEIDDLDENDEVNFSVDVSVPDDEDDVDEVDLWVDGINVDDDDQVTEPVSDLANNVVNCEDVSTATATTTATATATTTPAPTATPDVDDAC
jgi:hypothetical protein